jgi:hypothetical protein
MMQLCGTCAQQVAQTVPILVPALWLLALAAFTAVVSKTTKGKGK